MADPEIREAAVQAAAEVLERQYDSQYDGSHLAWRDFADEAREVLAAALPHLDETRILAEVREACGAQLRSRARDQSRDYGGGKWIGANRMARQILALTEPDGADHA